MIVKILDQETYRKEEIAWLIFVFLDNLPFYYLTVLVLHQISINMLIPSNLHPNIFPTKIVSKYFFNSKLLVYNIERSLIANVFVLNSYCLYTKYDYFIPSWKTLRNTCTKQKSEID